MSILSYSFNFFYSIDKVTSFAIHILPGTFYYLLRWNPKLWPNNKIPLISRLTWSEQFYYPLVFYLLWQIFYLIVHFVVIEKDPTLITSIRHLTRDKKNPATKAGTNLAIKLGNFLKLYCVVTVVYLLYSKIVPQSKIHSGFSKFGLSISIL